MKFFIKYILFASVFYMFYLSCSMKGKNGIFAKRTAREMYEAKVLKDSGKLNAVVNAWLNAAEFSLNNPLVVSNNFNEKGRFFMNDSTATAYAVNIKRGQKIYVSLNKIVSANKVNVYMDLWEAGDSTQSKKPVFITASDTTTNLVEYAAAKDQTLIIRFQQLLSTFGDYEFEIKTGPLFHFPISSSVKSNIGSLWGVDRDGGARKHEGIDIFAAKKSPVVAVADGVINSVSENELGGKVVFLRPSNMSYNVYYAHLDSQLVEEGQRVVKGQTIGLVGNTGNASTTAPHLHFGIYTMGGAIDPLLFVKTVTNAKRTNTSLPANNNFLTVRQAKLLNDITAKKAMSTLLKNTPVKIHAVLENYFRIVTIEGKKGFILKTDVKQI